MKLSSQDVISSIMGEEKKPSLLMPAQEYVIRQQHGTAQSAHNKKIKGLFYRVLITSVSFSQLRIAERR